MRIRAWFEPGGAADANRAGPLRDAATAAIESGRPAWTTVGPTDEGCCTWFVEPILPPPRLVVAGAGPDADPLVRFAHGLGWDVVVVDPRPGFADPARFAGLEDVAVVRCDPGGSGSACRRSPGSPCRPAPGRTT